MAVEELEADFTTEVISEWTTLITNHRSRDLILLNRYITASEMTDTDHDTAHECMANAEKESFDLFEEIKGLGPPETQARVLEARNKWMAFRDLVTIFVRSFGSDEEQQHALHCRERNLPGTLKSRIPQFTGNKTQRVTGTAYHGTTYHGTTYHGTAYHGTAYHGTAYHGTTYHGTAYHGTAYHGTAYHGTTSFGAAGSG